MRPILIVFSIMLSQASCGIHAPQQVSSIRLQGAQDSVVDNRDKTTFVEKHFTFLSANVGNGSVFCIPYLMKLCRPDVEDNIKDNIKNLNPEIVVLQEVLPDWACASDLQVSGSVCDRQNTEPQVRRLLGDNYTIMCESRNNYECIAVRKDVGMILGCNRGELCATDRMDHQGPGCRKNVSIMGVTVEVHGEIFDVVNAHPEKKTAKCRLFSLRQIFEEQFLEKSLIRERKFLLMGDLNLDPWREKNESAEYIAQKLAVDPDLNYFYHYHANKGDIPGPTLFYPFFAKTYDHSMSNFLEGTVQVLGEASGTKRLDGGYGMDHRALFGILALKTQ